LLTAQWTWIGLAWLALTVSCLVVLGQSVMADVTTSDGTVTPGLNWDALRLCAGLAWPTLLFWLACFVLVDRFRPQRPLIWAAAVCWGLAVAVTGSYFINSWVGAQMAVIDETSGVSAIRVAVFVAPFVEEGTKACGIFLIAWLDRSRFTSRVSGAVIGGLIGAGFAFTENIIYYARVVVYGSYTAGAGDVMAYLGELVWQRGVLTCFGHPLFTMMTGVAVGFALTSRSKMVRVIAPLAGYLLAAFLHMFFNLWASVLGEEQLTPALFIMVWMVVASVAWRLVMSSLAQSRTISRRLGDYVIMGWLPADFTGSFSTLRRRGWTLAISLWHGHPILTWRLQVAVTRLAMLREAITRGTVDDGADRFESQSLERIIALVQAGALVSGRGLRPYWPWRNWHWTWLETRRRRRAVLQSPGASQASMKYSAVSPTWGPPV
jgi:RsiW-degrading membrane proteinase PrsW (M82 family)